MLTVVDQRGDRSVRFVLPPSCKTEKLGVRSGIWTRPNADFVPLFSEDGFLNIKTYAFIGQERDVEINGSSGQVQPDRQTGLSTDVFEDLSIDIRTAPGERLADVEQIVEVTLDNIPLSARTTIKHDGYVAVIEHPIKTINVGSRERTTRFASMNEIIRVRDS